MTQDQGALIAYLNVTHALVQQHWNAIAAIKILLIQLLSNMCKDLIMIEC